MALEGLGGVYMGIGARMRAKNVGSPEPITSGVNGPRRLLRVVSSRALR
jgi:hypothetical protein